MIGVPHRILKSGIVLLSVGALALSLVGTASAADQPFPKAITHQTFDGVAGALAGEGDGTTGVGVIRNVTGLICSTSSSSSSDVNTDCDATAPHNETSIAVNPTDRMNLVGSVNDYQLRLSNGGRVYETIYSRAHVSFDGGATWKEYGVPYKNYFATGDPGVAFDADGRAYLSTLGFNWSQGLGCCTNPDILVSTSGDGGKTWASPTRVASGTGSFGSVGVFNDKEYIAAWGHGNAIVTWTRFNDGIGGSYISSPIEASVTHDGGATWSAPRVISGSAAFCLGAQGGTTCDQDQGSVPAVAADGSIYVSFLSTQEATTQRDQYLVVKVDPATGARIAGPFKVADLVDGLTDYPVNIDGRQTYQDSQFRTWSFGNIAADPTNASHLAVAWSDMRNSTLPAPADPYSAKTNSDVVVSQSFDGGATWSAPTAIVKAGDQFMPWAAYDASGRLRVGYFDRSYDPANHKYGYTLASEQHWGDLDFSFSQLTTTLSDPTQGTRWFSGATPNQAFPHPTTFLGDYSNVAALPGSGVAALWTDLRNTVTFTVRTGTGEDAYVAIAP